MFQSGDMLMNENKVQLAQINDINLKIFDEICAERFNALNLESVLTSIIDNVPSDVLPHLAEQYHVTGNEGWLQAVTEEEKRNLIKSSIKMHRYKGTKYALEEIFKVLDITGKVQEWFEYDGPERVEFAKANIGKVIYQDAPPGMATDVAWHFQINIVTDEPEPVMGM